MMPHAPGVAHAARCDDDMPPTHPLNGAALIDALGVAQPGRRAQARERIGAVLEIAMTQERLHLILFNKPITDSVNSFNHRLL